MPPGQHSEDFSGENSVMCNKIDLLRTQIGPNGESKDWKIANFERRSLADFSLSAKRVPFLPSSQKRRLLALRKVCTIRNCSICTLNVGRNPFKHGRNTGRLISNCHSPHKRCSAEPYLLITPLALPQARRTLGFITQVRNLTSAKPQKAR